MGVYYQKEIGAEISGGHDWFHEQERDCTV